MNSSLNVRINQERKRSRLELGPFFCREVLIIGSAIFRGDMNSGQDFKKSAGSPSRSSISYPSGSSMKAILSPETNFFTPSVWPDFDSAFFESIAINDQIVYPDGQVEKIFRDFKVVIWGPGQLDRVFVAGKFHESDVVAGRRFVGPELYLEAEVIAVKVDGSVQVTDPNPGVKQTRHGDPFC